ncbi:MAG: arylamine N-acetyltransferase [Sphingobium sp. SCN 64-10]|nr:MAG: arylamine N-acetyltransferase [Sphingobium sp. SCN 64-10]
MTTPDRLAAYLDRLRLAAAPAADADGLAHLQAAHRQAIAFENLDVRLGRPIRIDSERVFDKLVTRRRGGYCFEQNRLFSDMLAALGLPNRSLLARVRLGLPDDVTPPRTHVLLLVDLAGTPWIADAGFGASYVPPLPLEDGATARSDDGAAHRLRRIGARGDLGGEWLLERAGPASATDGRAAPHADWQPQYSFDLAPVAPDDLEQCNHWTSTRPGTRFTSLQIVSIPLPGGFATMTDGVLRIYRDGTASERTIEGSDDHRAVLAELFHLAVDPADIEALRRP